MLDTRYIYISFFVIISNLFVSSVGHTAKIDQLEKNTLTEQTSILDRDKTPILIKQKLTVIAQKDNQELEKRANNHLSLLGIAATSILFLIVLKFLFVEEKQLETPAQNQQDIRENSNQENKLEPENSQDLKKSEVGITYIQDTISKPTKTANLSDLTESADLATQPTVEADITGKLTIVTSSVTEIDVVFELIQDLQRNSHPDELSRHNDLRRKAIWELRQTNDFRAIKPLIEIIPQVDSLEKNLILDAITQIANHSFETINNVLLTSLKDENVEVRKNAIQDLTSLYQSIFLITAHISDMTKDSDLEVQQAARWALEQFEQMSIPSSMN